MKKQVRLIFVVLRRVLWTAGAIPSNRLHLAEAIHNALVKSAVHAGPGQATRCKAVIKAVIDGSHWTAGATRENRVLLTDAIYDALAAQPAKAVKLSPPQRAILQNLVDGRSWDYHLAGRSAYGGSTATLSSLRRHGFLDQMTITDAGRQAL